MVYMEKSSLKLSNYEKKFLLSLIEDGSKPDSDISKETKISKASASRIRKKLKESEILLDSILVINLEKFGISFYAVLFFEWQLSNDQKTTKKMEEEFVSSPQVVYFAEGDNPNINYIAMLAFFDFEDYQDFLSEFRQKYGNSLKRLETYFIQPKKILKQDYTDLSKMLIGGR